MIFFYLVELPSPDGPRPVTVDGSIEPVPRLMGPPARGMIRFREPVDVDAVLRGPLFALMEAGDAAALFPATTELAGGRDGARVPIRVLGVPFDPEASPGPVAVADKLQFHATGGPEYFSR